MNDQSNMPARLRSESAIVDEYDRKVAAIPEVRKAHEASETAVEMASTIGGTFAGQVFSGGRAYLHESTMRKNLLESAWKHVYAGLNLDKIAPASDRSRFEVALKDPAPFTLDNIRSTFGKYITDPRSHILRGLAECFSQLDPAFKSHDRMKVGVAGLPKRIILSSVSSYGSYGAERLKDTINAIRVANGQPHVEWASKRDDEGHLVQKGLSDFLDEAKGGLGQIDGMTLKRFQNGNGHLFFDKPTLEMVNRALAEYYGEVLPDCPEAYSAKRQTGTAVSKDLQFYRTPDAVADLLVSHAGLGDGDAVLEPSCGDGAILDAMRRYCDNPRNHWYASDSGIHRQPRVSGLGIEYDANRAAAAEAKGYSVLCRNFLEVAPNPKFDTVLMNPPFYGKHYQKHVEHARKFLKPGGVLYAILPITAVTDHGFVEPDEYGQDKWRDLPVGSFSESGTNINTGIARFFAP